MHTGCIKLCSAPVCYDTHVCLLMQQGLNDLEPYKNMGGR